MQALVSLTIELERSSRQIDEHLSERLDGGLWITRAAQLRYMIAIVRSWAAELPDADDADCDDQGIENQRDYFVWENERLRAAIAIINGALEALKS